MKALHDITLKYNPWLRSKLNYMPMTGWKKTVSLWRGISGDHSGIYGSVH